MILACKPMVDFESYTDLVQWLDSLYPTLESRPCYVIYDSACQVRLNGVMVNGIGYRV